jgi:hypothetical protein
VVKLAQSGNLRAIAFWLNRYLVPQQLCAQIMTERPGCLLIRVVCHHPPDCDRLVQFICQHLRQLNAQTIQQIRVTAQLVSSSELLWEKSVPLSLAAAPSPGNSPSSPAPHSRQVGPISSTAQAQPDSPALASVAAAYGLTNLDSLDDQTIAVLLQKLTQLQVVPAGSSTDAAPVQPSAKPPKPSHKKPSAKVPKSSTQPPTRGSKPASAAAAASLKSTWTTVSTTLSATLLDWQAIASRSAAHSVQWFHSRSGTIRALILGGSATSVFLLGCGFELLRYHLAGHTIQAGTSDNNGIANLLGNSTETVKTALERVPVIQPVVVRPEDTTITLLFGSSTTLNPASTSAKSPTSDEPAAQLYRQADIAMVNLDNPLTATASPSARSQDSAGSGASATSDADTSTADRSALKDAASDIAEPSSEAATSVDKEANQDGQANQDDQTMLDPASPASSAESATQDTDSPDDSQAIAASPDAETQPTPEDESTSDNESSILSQLPKATDQQLMANGVDVVNLASHQLLQNNPNELGQTLTVLQQDSIYSVGAGQDQQSARRPQIFKVKGKRIAYLGYSDSSTDGAGKSTAGLNASLNSQIEADIKAIRNQVDWVVVSYHWNKPLRAYPEDWQVELTHFAIDQGADLVVGYRPEIIQGAEIYNGRPIVYSLGSSIDEYADNLSQERDTVALKVTLQDQQMRLEFLPIQVRQGKPELVDQDNAGSDILRYLNQASSLFERPMRSPAVLDTRMRISLPTAPNSSTFPSDPFVSYPSEVPLGTPEFNTPGSPSTPKSTSR